VRNLFVAVPDKKVKLVLAYPMTTGRNLDEVPLVIDSRHLTARHRVAAPMNRQQGQDALIADSVCDEQDRDLYPDGSKAPLPTRGLCEARAGPNRWRSDPRVADSWRHPVPSRAT